MSVGVFRYSALGDIAAAIPVLRAFRKKPLILTSPVGHALLEDEFDDFVILQNKSPFEVARFIYALKKRQLELFIDLQNNDRSRFTRLFFQSIDNREVSFKQSVTNIFYDIAKKSNLVEPLDYSFKKKEPTYIVLNTGSSPKWISKRLPVHKWREFSKILIDRFGLPFVLTGDESEREYVEEIAKNIVGKKEVVAGKTTIQDLKKILREAFIVVSTDSAPMHIAAVQKTPTIGLFGATNWIVSAPFGPWSVALWDKKRFARPPVKNLQAVGDYYEGIDLQEGLQKLAPYL
ncbi:ADP-heptose:LPS heptosyltransferase II [Nitratiruptor sp. YY08-26]|uniref:glycosyltransferase family 9 protein n=1 Tax=unclassified Nitratiruptor TaxID=2624044 RepID=UPI001915114F|nr:MULTISPECIES: glycosyltransferase family 9 protein [unclassified Nitratiruptor]BCD62716.1 ADP-heptose:LPS heptosyltransferase II [Nitratiruptor sp. YY08-13]BCD66652.1 ADP-heptose:LPS heptosyltransferase II [Nitratiruptor sp. YY08-26]